MTDLRPDHDLHNCSCFLWLQIISSIPENWKYIIIQSDCSKNHLLIHKHRLIKTICQFNHQKTNFKRNDIFVFKAVHKVSSNLYFEELFKGHSLNWELKLYSISCITAYKTYMCLFQNKIFGTKNLVLFLNKKLYLRVITNSSLPSFCGWTGETRLHLPHEELKEVRKLSQTIFYKRMTTSAYSKSSNFSAFNLTEVLRDELWDNYLQNGVRNFLDFLLIEFY